MYIKSILLYSFIAYIYTDMSEEVTVHWASEWNSLLCCCENLKTYCTFIVILST